MYNIFNTTPVSQSPMGWSKASAPRNNSLKVVTAPVSQVPMGWSKAEA